MKAKQETTWLDAYTTQNLYRILCNQTVMCYVSQILWDCVTQYTSNTMAKIQTWHQVCNWLRHFYTQQNTLNGLLQGVGKGRGTNILVVGIPL